MSEQVVSRHRGETLLVWFCFFVIYTVWGSTYLAIRFAVETIPPLLVAGLRHLTAGTLLFTWAWLQGYRPTAREWRACAVLGVLFFLISHGSLHWAERFVPSGLAALLVATEPMWIALIACFVVREERTSSWRSIVGLFLGFAGVAVLTTEESIAGNKWAIIGTAAIIVGTLSWTFGMMYGKRAALPKNAVARSAMPLLTGALFLLIAALLTGEVRQFHPMQVSVRSWLGLGYLVLFGTVLAFTAYTWLLARRKASVVATHTYVNPVVAVVLGWLLGGEQMNARVIVSAALVVISVVLVTTNREERSLSTSRQGVSEQGAA